MTSLDTPIASIRAYGYNAVEARFLHLVATHSGYFLRRQFVAYSGRAWDYCGSKFGNKLIANRQGRCIRLATQGQVFSLCSRCIYKAASIERLRPYRDHVVSQIETRLAILDFVLSNPDCKYLSSESDKVSYFSAGYAVPTHDLPSREFGGRYLPYAEERFFTDGHPVFFVANYPQDVPVFTFFQDSALDLGGLAQHLKSYLPLFHRLPKFDFWFLARHSALSNQAAQLFHEAVVVPLQSNPSSELLRYFRIRKEWDYGDRESIAADDLVFRGEVKSRFASSRFENLYHAWKTNHLSESEIRSRIGGRDEPHVVRFRAQKVEPVGDLKELEGELR
jgi:hypothetical protein